MELTEEQIQRITARLGRETAAWLRDRSVEKHYSAEALAEILEVAVRSVWNYIELYESTAGREGIGPVVKISHKVVRIPASAVNRFLRAKTIDAAVLAGAVKEAA
jgi:hypothetical protein